MVCRLPQSLLILSLFSLRCPGVYAQQAQMSLSLNTILPMTLTSSMTFSLPSTTADVPLSISVALCSDTQPYPKFVVNSNSSAAGGSGGGTQLSLNEGIGVWTGVTGTGDTLVISLGSGGSGVPGNAWTMELGVSTGAPLHRSLSDLPHLGDTTATQALLFSPPFAPPSHVSPSYPNYTLPTGNISFPDAPPPSSQPNASLILSPTSQLQQQSGMKLTKSACAIKTAANSISGSWLGTNGTGGVNGSTSLVLRDASGWRSQWIIEGLTANTNYSAWVIQDGGALAGPIYAFTKSSTFTCPLVHSLPFCPLISYAVPLPPTPDGATSYSPSNLPTNVSDPLISSITNFTVALLSFPCGRDVYSPVQTCESCADTYRQWVCAVSFPRCGEIPPTLASSLAAQPTVTKESESYQGLPTPALLPSSNASRALDNNSYSGSYNELLPCIETCNAVDRACPPLFGWVCPQTSVNANWSYGVGFIDSLRGVQGKGVPGVAQDQWGVAWCNG